MMDFGHMISKVITTGGRDHRNALLLVAYRLIRVLGVGSYGAVFLGIKINPSSSILVSHSSTDIPDPSTDLVFSNRYTSPWRNLPEKMAIKCLFKQGLNEAQLEAQKSEIIINQMLGDHPNITHLYQVFEDVECVYLMFEYCGGGDLYRSIAEHRGFDLDLAKSYMLPLLGAIVHCHGRGVYHRDLKPENVLLDEHGQVKLADFGLATMDFLSRQFEYGSKPYMAPEVLLDTSKGNLGDYRSDLADVWSLGVIFYNLITGQDPWKCATMTDRSYAAFIRDPEILRHRVFFGTDVLNVFEKVFQRNPDQRSSLNDMRSFIELTRPPLIVELDHLVPDYSLSNASWADEVELVEGSLRTTTPHLPSIAIHREKANSVVTAGSYSMSSLGSCEPNDEMFDFEPDQQQQDHQPREFPSSSNIQIIAKSFRSLTFSSNPPPHL
jgi:serine/threonine protein kinase